VQGILRLVQSGRVSQEGLEHAARLGLTFNKTQFGYIQSTAEYFEKNGNRPSVVRTAPRREASSMYLHKPQEAQSDCAQGGNSFEREEINDQ
jgi:hypothetical protein